MDVRLLAIAGPPFLNAESIRDACLAAEAGGVTAVQIRLKDAPAGDLERVTREVVAALRIPVYVNDRADVALAAGAAGVHLGAEDIDPQRVRALGPRPFRIGVSVGSPDEAAAALRADLDYWSVGSVYATGTKLDAGPPIGSGGFRALAQRAPESMPVIAIGGIDRSNAAEILGAGAAGIAVVSAIFGGPDIERCARTLRDIVDSVLGSTGSAQP